jgi:hypothetical protein
MFFGSVTACGQLEARNYFQLLPFAFATLFLRVVLHSLVSFEFLGFEVERRHFSLLYHGLRFLLGRDLPWSRYLPDVFLNIF